MSVYDIPDFPEGDKFSEGPPCVPGGVVVDSAVRMDGYVCCSACRGVLTLVYDFDKWTWVHIP